MGVPVFSSSVQCRINCLPPQPSQPSIFVGWGKRSGPRHPDASDAENIKRHRLFLWGCAALTPPYALLATNSPYVLTRDLLFSYGVSSSDIFRGGFFASRVDIFEPTILLLSILDSPFSKDFLSSQDKLISSKTMRQG